MTEIALWEDVWDVINDEFTLLASQVLAAAPDKRWLAHHFDNEHWALSGRHRSCRATTQRRTRILS